MVAFQGFLTFASAASLAAAHFTLDSPPTRGFDEDKESTAPCGGFDVASSTRTSFGIRGSNYQINSRHATANVEIRAAAGSQSVTFDTLLLSYTLTGLGTFCGRVPGNVLAGAGLVSGHDLTLQVVYKAGSESSALYQCTDLMLVDSITTASPCMNGTNVQVSNVKFGQLAAVTAGSTTDSCNCSTTSGGSRTSNAGAPATAGARKSEAMSVQAFGGSMVMGAAAAVFISMAAIAL